jgi:ABC-2 type transport system permease protein
VPGFLLVVVLVALCAAAFGSVGAALALKSGKASVVQGIFPLVFVILFLSSAYFPRDLLLQPAETIAQWNPMSFIAEGIREPIAFGMDTGHTLKALLGIGIVGAIGAALSSWALSARLRSG